LTLVGEDDTGTAPKSAARDAWSAVLTTINDEVDRLASPALGRGLAGRLQAMVERILDSVDEGMCATTRLIECPYPTGWGFFEARSAAAYLDSCLGLVAELETLLTKIGDLDAARNQSFRKASKEWGGRLGEWRSGLGALSQSLAASRNIPWGRLAAHNMGLLKHASDGDVLTVRIDRGPPVVVKLADEKGTSKALPAAVVRKGGLSGALRSVVMAVRDGRRARGRVEIYGVDEAIREAVKARLVQQTEGTFEIRLLDGVLPVAA
jgi:hypothetical protein